MYLPNLKHAKPIRRYIIGDYTATLLTDCETSSDLVEYGHILIVSRVQDSAQTVRPVMVISSQTSPDANGNYNLCCSKGNDLVYDTSPDYGDLTKFEEAAFRLTKGLLKVSSEPAVISQLG